MAASSQKEILASAGEIVKGLEKLRHEQEQLLNEIPGEDERLRADMISRNIEKIELGLEESRAMFLIAGHLSFISIERQNLKNLSRKLDGENTWLTNELMDARKQLKASEDRVIELEEATKRLEFENELLKSQLKLQEEDVSFENFEESDQAYNARDDSNKETTSPMISEASAGCELSVRHRFLCRQVAEYVEEGKYECAATLCKQVIKDRERFTGHYHPDVATLLNILALVYCEQKMYPETEALLKDALRIRERTLGERHPAVATTINNLAVLYDKQNKPEEAEAMSKRSLQLREQALGPEHPDITKYLKTLALLYQNHGKYQEAVKCYLRALKIYQTNKLPEDKNAAEMKIYVSHCYLKQKKFQDITNLSNVTTQQHQQQQQRARSDTMASPCSGRLKLLNSSALQLGSRRYSISSPNKAEFNQISLNRVLGTATPEASKQQSAAAILGVKKSLSSNKKTINYYLESDTD